MIYIGVREVLYKASCMNVLGIHLSNNAYN